MARAVHIVFDGPPGPTAGRFVEVVDANGKSIKVGKWIDRGDGYWGLRLIVNGPAEGGCPYCSVSSTCDDYSEGYLCSRPPGHGGDHIACGGPPDSDPSEHCYEIWS